MTPPDPAQDPLQTHIKLHNDRARIEEAERALIDALQRRGHPKSSIFAVRLAFEEAVVNAFRHGHRNLATERPVQVTWEVGPSRVKLSVEDEGPGFDPESIPDPTLDENLETPAGRGIMLIRAYMASVTYNKRGNRINMTYIRPQTPQEG